MSDLTGKNFGLLIAYVLPGFVALWGVGRFSKTVDSWITASQQHAPTVGGFLYVTLASLALGLTVSAVRWATIDTLHHKTGIKPPSLEFSTLGDKLDGFHGLVENHYRYYQFYSNMFVSLVVVFLAVADFPKDLCEIGLPTAGCLFLELVFLAGSRDALRKYYARAERLLGTTISQDGDEKMTNGYDHEKAASKKTAPKKTKPTRRPEGEDRKDQSGAR